MPIFNFLACSRRVLSLLSIAVFSPFLALAQTSTGPKSPQAASGWTNPTAVFTSNNVRATADILFSQSGNLIVTGFGFTIPPTEEIEGITVQIERSRGSFLNHVADEVIQLTKNGTTVAGVNKADDSIWPTTDGLAVYGGPSDDWGITFTPAEINSANFGVVISISGLGGTGRVDHVQITVHHRTAIVPITLSSFDASVTDENTVRLNWTTASEINNDLFTVEKSVDGEHYTPVTNVEGSGNTTTPHHYQCEDRQPYSGRSYYRLKQTDFDGTFSYSHVVKVDYHGPVNPILVLLPNPGRGNYVPFRILGMQDTGTVRMAIYDLQGRMLARQDFVVDHPGVIEDRLELDAPLSAGLHIVKAGPGLQMTRKLLIRR